MNSDTIADNIREKLLARAAELNDLVNKVVNLIGRDSKVKVDDDWTLTSGKHVIDPKFVVVEAKRWVKDDPEFNEGYWETHIIYQPRHPYDCMADLSWARESYSTDISTLTSLKQVFDSEVEEMNTIRKLYDKLVEKNSDALGFFQCT